MLGNIPLITSLLTAAGAIAGAIYLPMLVKHTDLKKIFSSQVLDIMVGILLAYGVISAIDFITTLVTWHSNTSFFGW